MSQAHIGYIHIILVLKGAPQVILYFSMAVYKLIIIKVNIGLREVRVQPLGIAAPLPLHTMIGLKNWWFHFLGVRGDV